MTFEKTIVNALDRSGGRTLLAKIATFLAKRELRDDVVVFHDGKLWIHRNNATYFPMTEGSVIMVPHLLIGRHFRLST